MDLVLVRHGPAEERDPVRYPEDDQRPLSKLGREETRRAAKGLARLTERPELIATSPATRAAATARLVARAFAPAPRLLEWPELAPEGTSGRALERAGRLDRRFARVFLVGHEPTLGELVGLALSGESLSFARLGRAGAACLEFPGPPRAGSGRLRWLVDRKLLSRLG
jgi:phosphohistidine phosphatase